MLAKACVHTVHERVCVQKQEGETLRAMGGVHAAAFREGKQS